MFAENSARSVHQAPTIETVRTITGCLPVSDRVKSFRLRFFGHLARSAPEEDHHRVIAAALRSPTDWRRPVGRPRPTWLRTIDEDVQPMNFGVIQHGRRQEIGILGNKSSVYGNALLGVRYQEEVCTGRTRRADDSPSIGLVMNVCHTHC